MDNNLIVEMKNICKFFPGVRANCNVNLAVRKGEVHALLGENGAGKSTLMNVLYGLYAPTTGEIFYKNNKVDISSPRKAIEMGIGMVHQHFMLVPVLTVIENIVLGLKSKKSPLLDLKTAALEVSELAESLGMTIDPWEKVWRLSVGQQQKVEILKAIYRGAELLILDEPTSVLTPQEVTELFQLVRNLVENGCTIILISHKLKEIMSICDRITILRLGETVVTLNVSDTNPKEIAHYMMGHDLHALREKETVLSDGGDALEVSELECDNNKGLPALKKISFCLKKGEILGVCGVDGNGQNELVDAITGLTKATGGSIRLKGEDITNKHPREILNRHVSHIPEDRHKRSVILSMDLTENVMLMEYHRPVFSKGMFLKWPKLRSYADELIAEYKVKTPGRSELMKNLSGGNQQKIVLGREIKRDPDVLIAMNPSRGLDVGATEFVHDKLIETRNRGKSVLLISTELDEIMALSDRIAVIYGGEIVAVVSPEISVKEIGLLMAGETRHLEEIAQRTG